MTEKIFYTTLAGLNAEFWWLRALLTLAAVWLFVDLARGAPWGATGLKLVLALTCFASGTFVFDLLTPWGFPSPLPWAVRAILPKAIGTLYLASGIVGVVDAMREGTALRLPDRGWRQFAVVGGCVLAIGFPAYEMLLGHAWPRAQAFATGPAPIVVAVVAFLGASRTRSRTGLVWFWLMAIAGIEMGIVAPIFGLPHRQAIVALAVAAGIAMLYRPEE